MAVLSSLPKRDRNRKRSSGIARGLAAIGVGVAERRARQRGEKKEEEEKSFLKSLRERQLGLEERRATLAEQREARMSQPDQMSEEDLLDLEIKKLRLRQMQEPDKMTEEDLLDLEIKKERLKQMRSPSVSSENLTEKEAVRAGLADALRAVIEQGPNALSPYYRSVLQFESLENTGGWLSKGRLNTREDLFKAKTRFLNAISGEKLSRMEKASLVADPTLIGLLDRAFLILPEVRSRMSEELANELLSQGDLDDTLEQLDLR